MSPLPLPLGRLLRCARGAGSPASRTGPGFPARSRPGPRGSRPLRLPPRPRQLLSQPAVVGLFPGFRPGPPRARGKGGRESGELVPAPRVRLDLTEWGGAPPAASASRSGAPSCLPSFLRLPSALACSPAIAAVSLHIVRSLLPLPSPPPRLAFGLGISSLFITYFDPASLCPRFLRKFYCPRSRAFD